MYILISFPFRYIYPTTSDTILVPFLTSDCNCWAAPWNTKTQEGCKIPMTGEAFANKISSEVFHNVSEKSEKSVYFHKKTSF